MTIKTDWALLACYMVDKVAPADMRQWRRIIQLLDSDTMRVPAVSVKQQIVLEWSYDKKYLQVTMVGDEFTELYFRDSDHKKTITEDKMNFNIQNIRMLIENEFPALETQLALPF